ncbi:MAG: ATP-binding protein [Desulfurococcales archaeon]|nr:ATP-binding protein [Desulfurococcales archaeon]
MGRLAELVERAPISIRIAPALAGAGLALYAFKDVSPLLVAPIALAPGALLLASRISITRRRAGGGEGVGQCYSVRVEDPVALETLKKYLTERTRHGDAEFQLIETVKEGERDLYLIIKGDEREASVIESLVSAIFSGKIYMTPLPGCGDYGAPATLQRPLKDGQMGGRKYLLGVNLSKPLPEPFYLVDEDVVGHVGVYGSTGTGKSTTLNALARRVSSGYRVVVLDWTGEHGGKLSGNQFNSIDVSRNALGLDIVSCYGDEDIPVIVEILSRALSLTEPQAYMLSSILEENPKSVAEVYHRLAGWTEESRWDKEVKRALLRKIGTLIRASPNSFRGECGIDSILLNGNVVVDLSTVVDVYARRALSNLVLALLFLEARRTNGLGVVVALDEAHNLMGDDERDIFNLVLAEARKFGLHLVYATQSPSLIGQRALLNTNTKIVHALKSQRDKRVISDTMSLPEDLVYSLDKLPPGRALVQSPSHPEPVLVAIEP